MKNVLIQEWKRYKKFGLKLVPVRLTLKDGRKIVDIPLWKGRSYALSDLLKRIGFYNGIAVKTGGNLFVIDIDKEDVLQKHGISKEDLKDIPCAKTPKGRHYYFSYPAKLSKLINLTRANKKLGIDLRADGGIVFAPPSQIENGGSYQWIVPLSSSDLPSLPKKLEKLLLALFPKTGEESSEPINQKEPSDSQKDVWSEEIKKYLEKYPASKDRSGLDYHLACVGHEFNIPEKKIIDILWQPPNAKARDRGHGENYVSNLLNAVRGENLSSILEKIKLAPENEKDAAAEPAYKLISRMSPGAQERAIQSLKTALGGVSIRVIRTAINRVSRELAGYSRFIAVSFAGGERFLPPALGKHLLQSEQYINIHGILYRYEDGVFTNNGSQRIHSSIQKELGSRWVQRYRDEVISWIKDKVYIDPESVFAAGNVINVKNGMYNIETGELEPHDPDYRSIVQLPVVFNPEAECPRLEKFMTEVFPKDAIPLLWEHCGYILLNTLDLKKFLVLVGDANSGKSKWLALIEAIVGEENTCNESLHHLVDRPFAVANLFGKIVNVYADLETEAIKYTGLIKMLTGGDTLHAEIKHGKTFYFRNRARLFFSTNDLPQIRGYDRVFFERLHIVRCPNKFILGKNADPYILRKLATEEGKSAWLNHAIEGARRLLENEDFTKADSVGKEVKDYEFSADSVAEFVHTMLETVEKGYETKETIYAAYSNWAHDVGRKPVSMKKFSRRVQSAPHNFESFHPIDSRTGDQVGAWNRVNLSEICGRKYDTASFEIKND